MKIFHLPDLGEGLHDAEIIEWHVAPGETVEAGQSLVSVETDKATVDIPSPHAGRIAKIHGSAGEQIQIGAALVEFEEGGREDTGALVGILPDGEKTESSAATAKRSSPPGKRVRATPAIRARARKLGIDLATVRASGADGQVTAADLDDASRALDGPVPETLRGPRRAMARNMAKAHAEIAAATVTGEALVPHWSEETDVTVVLVKAVAGAACAVPALNAWFDGDALTRTLHDAVDIGIAMDSPDGLYVPVLRDAARRDPASLRDSLDRLKTAVASRSITPSDLSDPTISLSNFGTIGGHHAALVVMPPQVAILGVGVVTERVVSVGSAPTVRRTAPLSLTFDHRAVTGGEATRFLAAVIDRLETPVQANLNNDDTTEKNSDG